MRPIDWSPLVVFLAALAAIGLTSLLPDNFFLSERTTALIIWVVLTLGVLHLIRRRRRKMGIRIKPQDDDLNHDEAD